MPYGLMPEIVVTCHAKCFFILSEASGGFAGKALLMFRGHLSLSLYKRRNISFLSLSPNTLSHAFCLYILY